MKFLASNFSNLSLKYIKKFKILIKVKFWFSGQSFNWSNKVMYLPQTLVAGSRTLCSCWSSGTFLGYNTTQLLVVRLVLCIPRYRPSTSYKGQSTLNKSTAK